MAPKHNDNDVLVELRPNKSTAESANASTSSSTGTSNPDDLDTRGVSVYHLQHVFLEKEVCRTTKKSFPWSRQRRHKTLSRASTIHDIENLHQGTLPGGVIRNKGANTICPIDGKMGAAYVHCLQGKDRVGEATHMLSYSSSYTIAEIVDTLTGFCCQNNLNPKRTYIWMCCLCVNPHRVAVENTITADKSGRRKAPSVDFVATLGERVKKIGHLLAMISPLSAPVYLTRVWCIFEIFTAHTTHGCKVDILMPPKEKLSLEQDLVQGGAGVNSLYEMIGNIRVEDANASLESVREAILQQVESGVGCSELNCQVKEFLRGWILSILTQLVEAREKTNGEEYDYCNQIGFFLDKNGEHNAATKVHQTALTICETNLNKNDKKKAATCHLLGLSLKKQGDYDGALKSFQTCLAIALSVVGRNHPRVATIYGNIGSILEKMGDYDGALENYEEAVAIRLPLFGKDHPSIATTYNNMGVVLYKMGDTEGALAKYMEALVIRESALGKDHPDVAATYNNIGAVLLATGDLEGAFSRFHGALAIREHVLGKDHPAVTATNSNIAAAQRHSHTGTQRSGAFEFSWHDHTVFVDC
ncbi:Kinesin light chain [Seminavis robusta]|uniref:Kinesin light chain n=1 Tax=Seminavis robusta TaxID=568900 RepID=A0A9N8DWK9_9STRA|nr:Kinesin light chain [Seminavis robusta]|eukprot:Sro431_g141410.1 Kinesin light chain (587) ;mRNA; r:17553-19313